MKAEDQSALVFTGRYYRLLLRFPTRADALICEQRFKRLKRGRLVQYFRHNETFLLSLYFPAILICGYSPSPQRPPGNSDSVIWHTKLNISPSKLHLTCNKTKLASLESRRMFQAPIGHISVCRSHAPWRRGSLWLLLVWEEERRVRSLPWTMLECFFPVHSLKQCAILYLIST